MLFTVPIYCHAKSAYASQGLWRGLVARIWSAEWAKEGKKKVDWERLMPQRGFRVLPTAYCVDIHPHAMHVRV